MESCVIWDVALRFFLFLWTLQGVNLRLICGGFTACCIILTYTWMLQISKLTELLIELVKLADQLIMCIWLAAPDCYLPSYSNSYESINGVLSFPETCTDSCKNIYIHIYISSSQIPFHQMSVSHQLMADYQQISYNLCYLLRNRKPIWKAPPLYSVWGALLVLCLPCLPLGKSWVVRPISSSIKYGRWK